MKRLVLFLMLITLTSCGINYPGLDSDAVSFNTTTIIDEKDDDASYLSFTYNGRSYLPFGTNNRSIKEKDIDKCIGYLITGSDDKTRIYTLVDDKENNFLMEFYDNGSTFMNPIIFYRAVDTKGKDINIPDYIYDSLDNIWK